MALNIELNGAPDEEIYRSLLNEKMSGIMTKDLSDEAAAIRDTLVDLTGYTPGEPTPERFKPSAETVAWMHDVVESLYGSLLSHVPEQDMFTRDEVADIFRTILSEGFGESAAGWTVVVEKAQSITVQPSEKRIIIPDNKADMKYTAVRKTVVHEIGVHVLRAIQGSDTDLPIAGLGLAGYEDSEEGLGVVMAQALVGEFVERGIGHYITAGAAYIDNKNFRDIFKIQWRLAVLEKVSNDTPLTNKMISDAQDKAYDAVMRIMRGTDELPWFKDLAYYNGATGQWSHLESIRGDDVKFIFVLLGKEDPANIVHERVLYETRTN